MQCAPQATTSFCFWLVLCIAAAKRMSLTFWWSIYSTVPPMKYLESDVMLYRDTEIYIDLFIHHHLTSLVPRCSPTWPGYEAVECTPCKLSGRQGIRARLGSIVEPSKNCSFRACSRGDKDLVQSPASQSSVCCLFVSVFINNSVNQTLVGLGGCQLWILIWAVNVLIWAMNNVLAMSNLGVCVPVQSELFPKCLIP